MSWSRFAARAVVLAAALAGARASAGTVVSLNFDDNTATHRIAQRLLDERGMKGSFYINTQYIGTSGYYLSRADLSSLAAGGHEIAGHTLTHQILTNVSAAEARRQACNDRTTLQSWGSTRSPSRTRTGTGTPR
ncbi:MAG: polysaccharide deacetylase family protein [Elusimicrobiota bacterium]|nr:MAG: polysaccharide deacetylase family protein [Elusimicrobiota bacterium]